VPDSDWRAELAGKTATVVGFCKMLTATITFGAIAEGVPALVAMTALAEQLVLDTRWNTRNPLIHPKVVPGPWKHLVFGHPARPDGAVDRGAYIFCVLEQFCRHLKRAGDLRRGLHQVPQPAGPAAGRPGMGGGQG
jgi:hypothetical protein